ncbi:hypothetical protein FQZ97_952950 [compost metagenome]
MAVLSRRNSGLTATPKSMPAFIPEQRSSMGTTTFITVPGSTVLRTTTVWREPFSGSTLPICSQTWAM